MKHNHYKRDVSGIKTLDVYRLLEVFEVTCPVAQHVIKKALVAGQRGHKDVLRDWQDILDSAERKIEMLREDAINEVCEADIKAAAAKGRAIMADPSDSFDEARIDRVASSHGDGEHYAELGVSDSGGWIEWGGAVSTDDDDAPVSMGARVAVRRRNGNTDEATADQFPWWHDNDPDDIIAYRVLT